MDEEMKSIEILRNDENYAIWKFQIDIYISSLGLQKIASGKEKYEAQAEDEKKEEWKKKDGKVKKMIINTVEKRILTHLLTCNTSEEMLVKLGEIFERDKTQRKCNLLQEFFKIELDKTLDIRSNISKLENIVHRLRVLGEKIEDSMLMTKIMSVLPASFRYFASAWESTVEKEKTLTNLIARLMNEENRLEAKEESVQAFKASDVDHTKKKQAIQKQKEVTCYNCKKIGHISRNCKQRNEVPEVKKKCHFCGRTNHFEKDCIFKQNYLKKYGEKTRSDEKGNASYSCFMMENGNSKKTNWIVDSGCTAHMVYDKSLMSEVRKFENSIHTAKEGSEMTTTYIGTIESTKCRLNNVLLIPELRRNLLSVKAVTQSGGKVVFEGKRVTIIDTNKKNTIEGNLDDGLFCIDLNITNNREEVLIADEKILLWHRKLGHLGKNNMKKIGNLCDGFNLKTAQIENWQEICHVCQKAKQTRNPFMKERTRASRPLEIVHTDVCGPVTPATVKGERYIVTFMDDYTHFAQIRLMKNKFETFEKLKEYSAEAETKWNKKIEKFRCDKGGEYTSNEMKMWCRKRGTMVEYTVTDTPEQNGKAERLNRTIFDRVRAMIFDSNSDKRLWGEAAKTATYLINRSPSSCCEKTPAENWWLKKPCLNHLEIFGSLAYAKEMRKLRKLDERCRKFVFVGYEFNGYRLWDEETEKIIIARDVRFENHINKDEESYKKTLLKQRGIFEENDDNNDSEEEKENKLEIEDQNKKEEIEEENIQEKREVEDEIDKEEIQEEKIQEIKRQKKLPKKYEDFILEKDFALLTYNEAVNSEEKVKWLKAIEEEKKSLEINKTWKLVDETEAVNKKILSSKWVFKKKNNNLFKARLVVRGFEQEYGRDYEETYSPVINNSSLRIIMAIAARKEYKMMSFDVKTAFLYGYLEEDIFMKIPEGYDYIPGKVCKLQKSLYGLKQAPLRWNIRFTEVLKKLGFTNMRTEKCLFRSQDGKIILGIYVDDGILVGENEEILKEVLNKLKQTFDIKVDEELTNFLGMEVIKAEDGIILKQENFVNNLLKTFGMKEANAAETPLSPNKNEETNTTESETDSDSAFPYKEAVGSLLYLANRTRPDIAFPVNFESRRTVNTGKVDISNVKRTMRYVKGSRNNGLKFKNCVDDKGVKLKAFTDADFAGDLKTRKSTTGYLIFLFDGLISWSSRLQPIVALSSTEAEFIAAADCMKELVYLKTLVEELLNITVETELHIDNLSALNLIKNGVFNRRSKHIDVRYHFLHEKFAEGMFQIKHCESKSQLADILTKPLGKNKFHEFKSKLVTTV